ncbi:hypothetical protein D3C76_1516140 [compost metagenome]
MIDIHTVNPDAAAVHIVEAHKQVNERRLPCSCLADNGNTGTRPHFKAEITDQRPLRRISKAYFVKSDRPLAYAQHMSIRSIRYFRHHIENLEDPLCRSRC